MMKAQDPGLASQREVNTAAYTLMELGHTRAALPLLEWNVDRSPRSSNAHATLAEAHYLLGNRRRAVASYRRAHRLNPKSATARRMIELLR